MQFISAEASYPTTETPSGTRNPAPRTARIAPGVSGSLARIAPVTPVRSSLVVAAWWLWSG